MGGKGRKEGKKGEKEEATGLGKEESREKIIIKNEKKKKSEFSPRMVMMRRSEELHWRYRFDGWNLLKNFTSMFNLVGGVEKKKKKGK